MNTCAFRPCAEVETCCLPGGCVERRFGRQPVYRAKRAIELEGLKADAPAMNGTKAREVRDPVWTPRNRKEIRK